MPPPAFCRKNSASARSPRFQRCSNWLASLSATSPSSNSTKRSPLNRSPSSGRPASTLRASIPAAAPSRSAIPSAAPAQNSPLPSSANCSAAMRVMAWSPCASAAAWAPPASSNASDSWFCRRRASALFASRRFLPGSPASFVLVAASFAIFRPGFNRESCHLSLLLICSSRAFGGGHEICDDRVSDRRHLGRADHHTALLHVRSYRAERSSADHSSGILLRIRGRRSDVADCVFLHSDGPAALSTAYDSFGA